MVGSAGWLVVGEAMPQRGVTTEPILRSVSLEGVGQPAARNARREVEPIFSLVRPSARGLKLGQRDDHGRGAGRVKMCRHSPTDWGSPLARHVGHSSGVPALGGRGARGGQALERGWGMSRIG